MNYVYVLRSLKNNKRYVGYTALLPKERLKQHNSGSNKWAKGNRPFDLIYYEAYPEKVQAIKREIFLKSGSGRLFLGKILK